MGRSTACSTVLYMYVDSGPSSSKKQHIEHDSNNNGGRDRPRGGRWFSSEYVEWSHITLGLEHDQRS